MNCKRAQSLIALWVGDDLETDAAESLRRHVERCEECREYRTRMSRTLEFLSDCEGSEGPVRPLSDSVWPDVAQRLRTGPGGTRQRARFNGFVPALAVTSALVVIFSFALVPRPPQPFVMETTPMSEVSSETDVELLPEPVYLDESWRRLKRADDGPVPAKNPFEHWVRGGL